MVYDSIVYPDFDNPPVIEVVCGIHFKSIDKLLMPHFGLLWERYKPDYPICQEVAPIVPVIEQFGKEKPIDFFLKDTPPLPRIWFVDKNDNGIIQIQRDRFLHNWRKVRPDDEYPRYPTVFKMFKDHFNKFEQFLKDNDFGGIQPLQYEMTYINHIYQGKGWENISQIGKIFPDFSFRVNDDRYLPMPDRINWRTSFKLPNKSGIMHVSIKNGRRIQDDTPMLLMDLTVRGISENGMEAWFDLAREWIVCGFADLTGHDIQKDIWLRRRQ